jgi:hypothetical protein
MSDKQLQKWVEDARQAVRLRTVIKFDGQRSEPAKIIFPDLDELRKNAQGHNTAETMSRLIMRGHVPDGAQTLELTFSPDLGPVRLTVQRGQDTLHTLRLDPGKPTEVLSLATRTPERALRDSVSPALPIALFCGVAAICLVAWMRQKRRPPRESE